MHIHDRPPDRNKPIFDLLLLLGLYTVISLALVQEAKKDPTLQALFPGIMLVGVMVLLGLKYFSR